uniref:U3 small nucleolar RNA-associated protein 6 N-terminal domain-containing protein n=1 Tax=Trypanosoma congolense (strain IL3000) TaxID=1068625 RepID=G0UV18_TRYCI|nr:conserved hypothetical protein [Trypanosoma congolense IL3000]
MARATAIQTRLEKLLPAMEEYFTSGFLTREETHEVARQRLHWEYRLVAKPLLLLDVQDAVRYELELEERLRRYCRATKVSLRHRWSVVERVESIYRIGLRHIKDPDEWELLRREFVSMLKEHSRHGSLSRLYGELMVRYPTRSALWAEAALYEGVEAENEGNARALVQQAVLTAGARPDVWNAAVVIELHFVDRLLKKILEERKEKEAINQNEREESDVVEELKSENAALAEVVVDLALVHAVAEEALESPAFGPSLLRLLVDSVTKFSYAKPVLERFMEAAARKMVTLLSVDQYSGYNGCGGSSGSNEACSGSTSRGRKKMLSARQQWTEVGITHFLKDYLALEVIMAERNVVGDAASFLRSGGRLPGVGTEGRKMAHIASLASSLALVYANESKFPAVRQLRAGAAAVVGELMEGLQRLGWKENASTACRYIFAAQQCREKELKNGSDGEVVALFGMLKKVWKGVKSAKQMQAQQKHDAGVERITAMLTSAETVNDAARQQMKPMKRPRAEDFTHLWQPLTRFLLAADRAAVLESGSTAVQCCTAAEVDLLFDLHSRGVKTGADVVGHAVVEFLQRYNLIPPTAGVEGVRRLCFSEGQTPVVLWKLFLLLERHCFHLTTNGPTAPREQPPEVRDDSDDSSNSDAEPTGDGRIKGRKLQDSKETASSDASFAAAGLKFLSGLPCGVLSTPGMEEERLNGCWALLEARVRTLTGLRSITRDDFSGLLRLSDASHATSDCGEVPWVAGIRSILTVAQVCQPLPRQVHVDIALPFLEALAIDSQKRTRKPQDSYSANGAVREAREAHNRVLAMYRQSANPDIYMPIVYCIRTPQSRDSGPGSRVSAAEMNAVDWARLVAFERDVAKDLHRAKEAAARARREALAPQQLLVMLNKY